MLMLTMLTTPTARATDRDYSGCKPIEVTWYSPTGIAGCQVYGEGIASWYQGPGVARNDCVFPWKNCPAISITSLDTGRTIVVQPTMYCDCYTTTANERIVDLDPAALKALELDPSKGLYRVVVEPADAPLIPDTAMAPKNS